ncbi:putative vacuolar membrane protein [Drosera capensis]
MRSEQWRWVLGLVYIVAVAAIWIAASFVVQSVVDAGVSPFLITYICNSLFVVYIPIVEVARYFEDWGGNLFFWSSKKNIGQEVADSEEAILLGKGKVGEQTGRSDVLLSLEHGDARPSQAQNTSSCEVVVNEDLSVGLDAKGRWTRVRVAKVSLLICPFWFLAQLTFNLSLKYTTVTSNTILSTASSLFTFLFALAFLEEKFTWVKLASVLFCMGGTIIVSLGDSQTGLNAINTHPVLGDTLSIVSAIFYAVYITLIRKRLPDDDGKSGKVSMAQFLGFLGLFNMVIFFPVAFVLNFTKLEPFYMLSWKQFGLVIGKGLLDNVLSDYLWAKAVLLTTTTVATAGLTIQVPLAAVVDTLTGNAPQPTDLIGAAAIMIGFTGINLPSDTFSRSKKVNPVLDNEHNVEEGCNLSASKDVVS